MEDSCPPPTLVTDDISSIITPIDDTCATTFSPTYTEDINPLPPPVPPSTIQGWVIHVYRGLFSSNFVVSSGSGSIEVLIVAGGGSGGSCDGTGVGCGGGGGGEVIDQVINISPNTYDVIIGGGGVQVHADHTIGGGVFGVLPGNNGSDSSAFGLTAKGGGGGGGSDATIERQGRAGGSGGGGASANDLMPDPGAYDGGASLASLGFGHKGGDGVHLDSSAGAGGGGAGGIGSIGSGGGGYSSTIENIWDIAKIYGYGGPTVNNTPVPLTEVGVGAGGCGGGQALDSQGATGGDGCVVIRYRIETGIIAIGGTKYVFIDPIASTGVAYAITLDQYAVTPGTTVNVTAQLVDTGNNPVARSDYYVLWQSTNGGTFSASYSTTDANGVATVQFTTSSIADIYHTITALDNLGNTGTSNQVVTATDGLSTVRLIGSCLLLIDSIAGVTGDGSNVTAVTDLSYNPRTVTLPGSGHNPIFTATKWDVTHPAMEVQKAIGHYLKVNLPGFNPPLTVVIVMNNYTGSDGNVGFQNIVNLGGATNNGPICYRADGTDFWYQFDGSARQTTIQASTSKGKVIRFDTFNANSTSITYRSGTASSTFDSGNLPVVAGNHGIGARVDGSDGASAIIAAVVIYSKALTAQNRADLITFFTARYPGISAV